MYNPTGHIIAGDLSITYTNFSTVRDVLVKVPMFIYMDNGALLMIWRSRNIML